MPYKTNKKSKEVRSLELRLKRLQRDTATRCFIMKNLPVDPPAILNSGDVWHSRTVSWYTVAGSGTYPALGTADLLGGAMMQALSPNSSNLPTQIVSIKCYIARGSASSNGFPTQLQVDFNNEEFTQADPGVSSTRDSIRDSGSQSNPARVGLYVPAAQRRVRTFPTGNVAVLATANVDGAATVRWIVNLMFKF